MADALTADEATTWLGIDFEWHGGLFTAEEARRIGDAGRAWLVINKPIVDALSAKTVIAINVANGGHVVGSCREEAAREFHAAFGKMAIAYIHDPSLKLGGGLWLLKWVGSTSRGGH